MKKSIFVLFLSTVVLCGIFAQGNAISMPSMPTVSAPKFGGGYYAPGSDDFYGPSNPTAPKVSNSKNSSNSAKKNESAKTESTPVYVPANPKLSDSQQNTTVAKSDESKIIADSLSELQNSELLKASDISSLGNLGYFRNLSGLLGLSRTQSSNSNSVDLETVLAELNDLKSRVDEKDRTPEVQKASFSTLTERESKILRFSINGYDMIRTIRTVYFSKEEIDGTFLLTGDRNYYADGKTREETFYLLFKSEPSQEGTTNYKVSASVSQNYENPNSYIFKLAELSKNGTLFAKRTGNFVTMKMDDEDFKMDLLLGIEK